MSFTMRVDGLEEAQRRLSRVNFGRVLQTIAMAVGELIREKLATYPPRRSGPVPWVSERQRRFYYGMRRRAGLPLAYTRQSDPMSQRLGPSWAVARMGSHGAVVATRVTYAPYVQSAERQQPMHRQTGWVTDVEAVDAVARSGDIGRVAREAIENALR